MRSINKNLFYMAFVAFLVSVSTFASARCSTDLKGTWQSYLLAGDGATFISCIFSTDREGNLISPDSTCQLSEAVIGGTSGDPFPAAGQYHVDEECNVTGSLTVAIWTLTVIQASMNRGGNAIDGIQWDTFSNGASEFSMQRID